MEDRQPADIPHGAADAGDGGGDGVNTYHGPMKMLYYTLIVVAKIWDLIKIKLLNFLPF